MRLRFGIPLMLGVAALATWVSGYVPFNAFYPVLGISAAWAAWDSHELHIKVYDSPMAMPPLGIAAAILLGWPITVPWYLKLRYRVRHGLIEPRGRQSVMAGYVIVGVTAIAMVGLYLAGRSAMSRPAVRDLMRVAEAVHEKYPIQNRVSLNGRTLAVRLINPVDVDTAHREEWMRGVAEYAYQSYPRPTELDSVAVGFVTVRQQGAMTFTNSSSMSTWAMPQYHDTGTVTVADDSVARLFIEMVRTRDARGAALLQPTSIISDSGWSAVARLAQYLPNARATTTTLERWQFGTDTSGTWRKLTYRVADEVDTATVELWLVDKLRTYVSTFRIATSTRVPKQ